MVRESNGADTALSLYWHQYSQIWEEMFHVIASACKDSHPKVPSVMSQITTGQIDKQEINTSWTSIICCLETYCLTDHFSQPAQLTRNPLFLDVKVCSSGSPTFVFVYDLLIWRHVYLWSLDTISMKLFFSQLQGSSSLCLGASVFQEKK